MEKQLIPKLRFSEYSNDWHKTTLGEVSKFLKGKNVSKNDVVDDGENECIRYGELYTIYSETISEVYSKTNLKLEDSVISKANDIIIPASGETQIDIATASCVLRDGVILGGDLNIIRTKNNGVFLSYYLNSERKIDIAKLSQGSSVVHLYSSQLSTLNLFLPKLEEQQKISTFLTSVDTKINQLNKKKSFLEQYKKGIMQKVFKQEIRFKDENGMSYPDWMSKNLGNICNYKNGGSFEQYVSNEGLYNLISLNSIDINGKLKSEHKKVTINDNSLDKGDLVMVLSDVAHGYFLGLTDIIPNENFVLNQRMGALKPKSHINVNRFFLKSYINFNQKYFKLMGQGSSQQNLSKNDILNFKVRLPVIEEQIKISDFLRAIEFKIELVQTQIDNTTEFKKGLLQLMFV